MYLYTLKPHEITNEIINFVTFYLSLFFIVNIITQLILIIFIIANIYLIFTTLCFEM